MKILAFETSAKSASVALAEDDKLIAEYYQNCGQTHSKTLMKMAQDLLDNCECAPEELTAIACASGPGSFTGVRIGVAAAKGMAWGLDKPCIGISTLEAMAHQAMEFEGLICCAMDARRDQVYNALFITDGKDLARLCEDRAISLEELEKELKNIKMMKITVGDGAMLCYNSIGQTVPDCICAPEHLRMQRASGVALAAYKRLLSGEEFNGAELVPNYLRLSQAERERLQKTEGV